MAQVFLSYARDDADRAKAFAQALERAGHSVWWDRQIGSGKEYSKEIDQALKQADAVLVLWSTSSVDSAWVRDEATVARDSGRLVPVSIDGTEPPLGFRQYQTEDLSGWKGRGRSAQMARLLQVIDGTASKPGGDESFRAAATSTRKKWWLQTPAGAVTLAAILLIAAGLVGWRVFAPPYGEREQLALAVMPFADMSPQRDQGYLAEGVAEEIMTLLSAGSDFRVIGRTSAWQLHNGESGADALRSKLGATHVLEGSVRSAGDTLRVTARLVDTRNGEQLWSEEYRRDVSDIFSVQEQIGASVAQRLRGTFAAVRESSQAAAQRTSPEAYKLYLSAKAVGRRRDYDSLLEAEQLLARALNIDGSYAPAHAYRAFNLYLMDEYRPSGTVERLNTARALDYANRAVALAPRLAEAHASLGVVLQEDDDERSLRAFARARDLDPNHFYAWNGSGILQRARCEYRDALGSFERATEIEPLIFLPHANLVNTYYFLGRDADAEEVANRFAATGADPPRARWIQGLHELRTGNISQGVISLLAAKKLGASAPNSQQSLALALFRLGKVDQAFEEAPSALRTVGYSYYRGDYKAVATTLAQYGPKIWDTDFAYVAATSGVQTGQSRELLKAIRSRFGSVHKFLSRKPCQFLGWGPAFVVALRETGDTAEADQILASVRREYRHRLGNGYAAKERHVHLAEILTLEGKLDQALRELRRAVDKGWLDLDRKLAEPSFASLRRHDGFGEIERLIARNLQREAAELDRAFQIRSTTS